MHKIQADQRIQGPRSDKKPKTPRYAPQYTVSDSVRHCQSGIPRSNTTSHQTSRILGVFIEELLGLVDLGGQVGTAATIGVVQQHELAVLLADLVLVQSTFTVD